MDPEDNLDNSSVEWVVTCDETPTGYDSNSTYDYTEHKITWNISNANVSYVAANDNDFNIVFDDLIDTSFGVKPVDNEPAVYTSYEQREQHEKYPALQKIWEDYLAMFALTKGEPPNVD